MERIVSAAVLRASIMTGDEAQDEIEGGDKGQVV